MRVLLVRPIREPGTILNVMPPIGLGYLATGLRKEGIEEVKILDCVKEGLEFGEFEREVRGFRPDAVGFQVFSSDLRRLEESLSLVEKVNPEILTLAGGPHPSLLPEKILRDFSNLDFAFVGEVETCLPQLLKGRKKEEIPGLVWRQNNKIRINPQVFLEDLDSLGFPAWDLLKPQEYPDAPQGVIFKNKPIAPIMATRGCPFNCTFCAGKYITGSRLRTRSVENVLEEIELLYKDYGIREIHFLDDNFTLRRDYVIEFCEKLLSKSFKISWCCPNGVRLDTLDLGILNLMKKSGCYYVSVGIESGSPRILKLMRKGLTIGEIKNQVKRVKKSGLYVNGFFILGYPGETREEILQTIKFAKSLGLRRAAFYNFLPLPRTRAYEDLVRSGEIREEDIDWAHIFQADVPYSPKGISRKELKRLQRRAHLEFYLRPRVLWGLLSEIRSFEQLKFIMRRAIAYLG